MRQSEIRRKIEISPAFVAVLCAYFYFDPAGTFFPFLLAVTLHEAGHLITLRLLKSEIHSLRFELCGATIHTAPMPYLQELLAALAGPAVNLVLFLCCSRQFPKFALVNFCLLFYNLLPFYPLDGGRALRALLHLLLEEQVATIIERIIAALCLAMLTALCCYLTCVWHAGLWPVLVCALLLLRIAGTILPERNRAQFFPG